MPLEIIQRLIGLLIGGFLPTDKQVNHILTPYMTYFYAHRLGSSIHDGVAELYGVETKRVNEAVKNNPDKFSEDYMFTLTSEEVKDLRSKFSSTKISTKSRVKPKDTRAKNKVESTKMTDSVLSTCMDATSGLLNLPILSGVP